MRLTAAEKHEIIRLVEGADLSVRRTLRELGVHGRMASVTDKDDFAKITGFIFSVLRHRCESWPRRYRA